MSVCSRASTVEFSWESWVPENLRSGSSSWRCYHLCCHQPLTRFHLKVYNPHASRDNHPSLIEGERWSRRMVIVFHVLLILFQYGVNFILKAPDIHKGSRADLFATFLQGKAEWSLLSYQMISNELSCSGSHPPLAVETPHVLNHLCLLVVNQPI